MSNSSIIFIFLPCLICISTISQSLICTSIYVSIYVSNTIYLCIYQCIHVSILWHAYNIALNLRIAFYSIKYQLHKMLQIKIYIIFIHMTILWKSCLDWSYTASIHCILPIHCILQYIIYFNTLYTSVHCILQYIWHNPLQYNRPYMEKYCGRHMSSCLPYGEEAHLLQAWLASPQAQCIKLGYCLQPAARITYCVIFTMSGFLRNGFWGMDS